MKNLFKAIAAIFCVVMIFVSCENSDDPMVDMPKSIYQLASSDSDLSSLKAAIDKAGLSATLDGSGSFTLFAPSNAAFTAFLTANGFASLNDVPIAALKEILLNHVLATKVMAAQVTTGYVSTLAKGPASASRNLSMYISTASGVKINGVSTVTETDIMATNGVIHKVDKVIGLPTIVTHATANPNFSSLAAALTRPDMPNFVSILGGTVNSPFTVMAPTNTAFTSLLSEISLPDLASIPQLTLENVLKYHVVAGANVASTDLVNNMVVTTFQGGTFKITTNGGAKITDAQGRVANINLTDVQCSNGIIHAVDKVLLP
ncbi:fasciclin domain-containing protein [Kaistella palustris]|uniref:fasciclin domain-containing protein n=1 Tax=Kaistella palustris TaxID=493376 RepID=UPI000401E9A1|nr:fasciclin domain-containing protein [Kaistella palustris]